MKRKATEPLSSKKLKNPKPNHVQFALEDVFWRIQIKGDGNCLFRAISYCLYGGEYKHQELRGKVCKYLMENEGIYKTLFQPREGIQTFTKYVEMLNQDGTWGDHLEIAILSKLFNFNVIIYNSNSLVINYKHIEVNTLNCKPLYHLEYENNIHFNVFKMRRTKNASIFLSLLATNEEIINIEARNNEMSSKDEKILINLPPKDKKKEIKTSKDLKKSSSQVVERDEQKDFLKKDIYPLAKNGHNTYNEVYEYFKHQITPE